MPLTELVIDSHWDAKTDWQKVGEGSARSAFSVSSYSAILDRIPEPEISIKLSDNEEVHKLNRLYREKDRPTNVLSFPQLQKCALKAPSSNDGSELLLGDIILAQGICQDEAKEKQISLEDHVAHLLIHGTLHLLGYDHQDDGEALLMEGLEVKALARLGIANPYSIDSVKR